MSELAAIDQIEEWEFDAPAHLQYWPAHVHPTGPGSWHKPRLFPSLREAIAAAAADPESSSGVAWILTSGGRILRAADVESLWLDQKAAEASGRVEPPRS
jgi:hypothetical protein